MEHLTLYDIECCREYYEQNFAHEYYMPDTETEQPEIELEELVRCLCEEAEINEAQETITYFTRKGNNEENISAEANISGGIGQRSAEDRLETSGEISIPADS